MLIGKFYLYLAAAAIAFLIYGIKYAIKRWRKIPESPVYSEGEVQTFEKHLKKNKTQTQETGL